MEYQEHKGMINDILQLDAELVGSRDPRLFFVGRKRRLSIRRAVIAHWRDQKKVTVNRATAKAIADKMGFPWVSIIMMVMKFIIWWVERRRQNENAHAAILTMFREDRYSDPD